MPACDPDLVEMHRSIHVYAGYCMDWHDASYNHYCCRRGFQCVELDRGQIDRFDSTPRRLARRSSLTTNRRIKCVSEHS
jgi:hypothetical protein